MLTSKSAELRAVPSNKLLSHSRALFFHNAGSLKFPADASKRKN